MDRLLIATRKGLIVYQQKSGKWSFDSVHFQGIPISFVFSDPYTKYWWACLDHGHWGCKLQFSKDNGKTWKETEATKYPEGAMIKENETATVRYLWSMNASNNNGTHKIYIGTEPGGIFVSENYGNSFELVESLWNHPTREKQWFGGGRDYAGIHSILINPKDNNHLTIGVSVAGVFDSTDGGNTWNLKNKGLTADFLPDPNAEVGQDPHLIDHCIKHPEVIWQQNHCGIFRTVDGGGNWTKISEGNGPADFGFTIQADEENPEVAWVVPAVSDEIRMAVDNALCVCRTDDGGNTWKTFRNGLPQSGAFDITYRHALAKHRDQIVFGTTTGNLYLSSDSGENWECLNNNLPMVYAVVFG